MPETVRYLYGIIKTNAAKSLGPCQTADLSAAVPTSPRVGTQAEASAQARAIKADEDVYTVVHRDIACVVSNAPARDYAAMLKEELGRCLVKHQATIEKIMKDHTIIPMKFGTFVADRDEVAQVLKRGYAQFKELLANMDGKIELDLAAMWNDLNSAIKEIGEKDREIRAFKAKIDQEAPDKTFQDRIKIGMMIKAALEKKRETEQTRIIDFLKEVTVDFQKHRVMDDTMILNCAFLLEKNKEPDLDSKLKELDREYNQKVNFKCVGPLPPYSFATCRIKKVGYRQIAEAVRLLGLSAQPSLAQIKEAYRAFAQTHHPDKHPGNSQIKEQFEEVMQGYKLLTSCCQGGGLPPADRKKKYLMLVEIVRPC